jgi:molybdopterin/thiamine biosynthesis adenylyltransferase
MEQDWKKVEEIRLGVIEKRYGSNAVERLLETSILIVGASSIGCELLQNLVQMCVPTICIVDHGVVKSPCRLHPLFSEEHIGKPKVEVN